MKNMQIFYKNLMQHSIDNLSENTLSSNSHQGVKDIHSEKLYKYCLEKITRANREQLISLEDLLWWSDGWFS